MPPIPECQTERQRDGAQIFLERQEPPNSQNLHSTAQAFAFPVRTKQVKVNVTRAIGSLREWQQKSMKDRVEGLGDRSNSQNAENEQGHLLQRIYRGKPCVFVVAEVGGVVGGVDWIADVFGAGSYGGQSAESPQQYKPRSC